MNGAENGSSMDRRIFSHGLSVEAVSLYILCCTLVDQGRTVSRRNIAPVWNSSEEDLNTAFSELEKRGVVRRILSDLAGNDVFRVMDSGEWN